MPGLRDLVEPVLNVFVASIFQAEWRPLRLICTIVPVLYIRIYIYKLNKSPEEVGHSS